ncbi:unnamed protein product [Pleuronectes platessa]|uniref:Uncharacterized protein n=1 Tax=Pleuronectes platessa TaxID=8262 RepID=A0A9N7UZX9_PLEPL|nr:unnamed protein product [Pleuronectes platessa]
MCRCNNEEMAKRHARTALQNSRGSEQLPPRRRGSEQRQRRKQRPGSQQEQEEQEQEEEEQEEQEGFSEGVMPMFMMSSSAVWEETFDPLLSRATRFGPTRFFVHRDIGLSSTRGEVRSVRPSLRHKHGIRGSVCLPPRRRRLRSSAPEEISCSALERRHLSVGAALCCRPQEKAATEQLDSAPCCVVTSSQSEGCTRAAAQQSGGQK